MAATEADLRLVRSMSRPPSRTLGPSSAASCTTAAMGTLRTRTLARGDSAEGVEGARAQQVVGQHQAHHGLADRHDPGDGADVVAAVDDYLGRPARGVDGVLLQGDGGDGLD